MTSTHDPTIAPPVPTGPPTEARISNWLFGLSGAMMLSAQMPSSWGAGGQVRALLLGSVIIFAVACFQRSLDGIARDAQPLRPLYASLQVGLGFMVLVGLCISILRGNPLLSTSGDLLRALVSLTALSLGRRLPVSHVLESLRAAAIILISVDLLLSLAYAALAVQGRFDRLTGGSVPAYVLLTVALWSRPRAAWVGNHPLLSRMFVIGAAATVTTTLLALTRAYWLVCIAAIMLAAISGRRRLRLKPVIQLLVLGLALVTLVTQVDALRRPLERRVETIVATDRTRTVAESRRFLELDESLAEFREAPANEPLGFGLGALRTTATGDTSHQIHNTLISIYFRHGLIGATLLGIPLLYLGFQAIRTAAFAPLASPTYAIAATIGLSILLAQSVYNLIGSPIFWLAAGAFSSGSLRR